MTLKASKSRKTPTLQQNTFKGLGSRTCRIGPVNRQNITSKSVTKSVIELFCVLNISTFMIFFLSFLCLWSKIWHGAQPPYKMKFWQCCYFIIPYKILWDWFCKQAVPLLKIGKFDFFLVQKCLGPSIVAAILERSTYIKVWRSTFWRVTMFLTKNPGVKLFECQAEVFGWLTQA